MDKLFIPIHEGTKRVQRKSIHAARLVVQVSKQYEEIESILVDPNDFDFPLPFFDALAFLLKSSARFIQ